MNKATEIRLQLAASIAAGHCVVSPETVRRLLSILGISKLCSVAPTNPFDNRRLFDCVAGKRLAGGRNRPSPRNALQSPRSHRDTTRLRSAFH